MQLIEGTLLQEGKYRIEGILGQGGFGITYKAIMQVEVKGPLGMIQTEIHVAIKEFFMKDLCNRDEQTCQVSVPSSGSMQQVESYRKKFWKEAQNLSKLSHPNIVKVLDVFNENNTSYYVMEYISGGSLQQYVKQQGAIPEETALTYIRQLASALDYMHQNHVCHLDLKPGNVLMDDKKSQVKLIDFGLSKQYDDEGGQTSSTPVGVSEGYAPMEQYELGGVSEFSPATDIYSLGATLFFLLSGMKPPKASLVLNEGLPKLPATISTATRNSIGTAMNPRRKDRPQTIKDFLALINYTPIEKEEIVVIDSTDDDTIILGKSPKKKESQSKLIKESSTSIIKKYTTIAIIVGTSLLGLWSIPIVLSHYEHPDFPHFSFLFITLIIATCNFYLTLKTAFLLKTLKVVISVVELVIFGFLAFIPFDHNYYELVPGKGYRDRSLMDKDEDYIYETDALPVHKRGKWGIIDTYGNIIVPYTLDYDFVSTYDGEYASITKNGKKGCIDKKGNIVIPLIYDALYTGMFSRYGIAKVGNNEKFGLINTTGEIVLPIEYDDIGNHAEEGLIRIYKNGKYGMVNVLGNIVIPPTYPDSHGGFSNGLWAVKQDGKWGFVNTTDKVIIPFQYKSVSSFIFSKSNKTYATVTTFDGREYSIDKNGEKL